MVIDDSALMRKYIRQILESQNYEVYTARNGEEGLQRIREISPDAVTLDINMPVMDGITCLSHIMTEMPVPVLMISSLTEEGAVATFEALELGAFDYVAKPGGTVSLNLHEVEDEIIGKLRSAIRSGINKSKGLGRRLRKQREDIQARGRNTGGRTRNKVSSKGLVAIGVSTGGPGALEEVISHLPADFPLPILVAQHMPARFTNVFAKRLNRSCEIEVTELTTATELEPGKVYIARGDADVKIIKRREKLMATSIPERSEYIWHPSVELMVESIGEYYDPKSVICVQLTGMGYDGAKAMASLHDKGARTIAESEESAVVFGMPKELIALNGADKILPIESIAQQLISWTQ